MLQPPRSMHFGTAALCVRHMFHLFAGMPGTRAWKRHLTEQASKAGVGGEAILDALAQVDQVQLRAKARGAVNGGTP